MGHCRTWASGQQTGFCLEFADGCGSLTWFWAEGSCGLRVRRHGSLRIELDRWASGFSGFPVQVDRDLMDPFSASSLMFHPPLSTKFRGRWTYVEVDLAFSKIWFLDSFFRR